MQERYVMKTIAMKFGGTSVGSSAAISNVIDIISGYLDRGDRVVSIVSAMSGVTDMLLESVKLAANENKWGYLSVSSKIRERHEEAINDLLSQGQERDELLLSIHKLLDRHIELCNAIQILGEVTPRMVDSVVSFGERMSHLIVTAALRQHGVNAKAFDAGELLVTDDNYHNAIPFWSATEANIRAKLLPELDKGVTPVITGFIGATQNGVYTTLGRGGSDYSAAIFAAFVDSDEFIIWTDVDGVMTTDPRIDKRAQVLPYVSYQEVGELAYYGAKVLHPKTVQPILDRGIPIRVRNTFNPAAPGTLIGAEMKPSSTIIKAITSVRNVSMLTVSGKGMLGVPGIAGRTFLASAKAGANILMISQSSSEQSFCFTVMDDKAETVKDAVEEELHTEILRQNVDGVAILKDVVIVTVIGAGMRGTPGIAGRVFTVLGDQRINVLSIAQGSSECSISFIVEEADLDQTVIKLHDLALQAVEAV
jgi:aspartate kinase